MNQREIAQLTFTEAHSDEEVFMRVSIVSDSVEILLTGLHNGDIAIYLAPDERKHVLAALEEAAMVIQGADGSIDREIASLRFVHGDSNMELVVNVRIERSLVEFYLAFEGDEDEEDMAGVFLNSDQCKWLIEALKKAELFI